MQQCNSATVPLPSQHSTLVSRARYTGPIAAIIVAATIGAVVYGMSVLFPTDSRPLATPPRDATTGVGATQAASSAPAASDLTLAGHRPPSAASTPGPSTSGRPIRYADSIDSRTLFPHASRIGYGRFVDEAAASADPALLAQAAALIRRCNEQDGRVEGMRGLLHAQRDGSIRAPIQAILEIEEDIQRRCQALTTTHKAQMVPMFAASAKARVQGSATVLYAALSEEGKNPAEYPWLLDALVADADRGEGVAFHTLACSPIGTSLPMQRRATYFAALEALASKSDGTGGAYRFMTQHCESRPDPNVQVDTQALSRLLAAAESASPR